MPTNYPGGLDDFENPDPGDGVGEVSHSGQHANTNDALEAIEAKLGINNSGDPNSLDRQMEIHAHTAGGDDGAVVSHDSLSGVSSDDHHAAIHAANHLTGGTDPLAITVVTAHTDLTAVTANQHHAQLHATAHEAGGSDPISVVSGATPNHTHTAAVDQGGLVSHDILADVSVDDHHPQSHGSAHGAGGADPIIGVPAVRAIGADYFIYKSGSNYIAFRTSDGTTPYTNTNAASVINQASTALAAANGGDIQLEGKTTFNCTTTVSLGAGVTLRGSRIASEGSSNAPQLVASANLGAGAAGTHALVLLNGTGAQIVDVNTAAGGNATECIYQNVSATAIRGGFHTGGTQHVIANKAAMPRQRIHNVRMDGANPGIAVFELFSTDHLVTDIVATGAGSVPAMIVNGNTSNFSVAHITGNATSDSALLVIGDQNNFSAFTMDTCGSNSRAPLEVQGSRNTFSSVGCMNVASGLNKPALALKKQNPGANVYGNMFFGFHYSNGAQNQNATGVVGFYTDTNATPPALGDFKGTQIFFQAANVDTLSGGITNRTPLNTEPVWIKGWVSSGSASTAGLSSSGLYNFQPAAVSNP